MDFIEHWLHISPDGGNGATELLIVTILALTTMGAIVAVRRGYFPKNFIKFLERLGKRENRDRFDK